jgi:hypothetical protein
MNHMIDRREALRRFGAATLASSLISLDADELLAGLTAHGSHTGPVALKRTAYRFQTLDAHQRRTIVELAEMIIPTTETPGAKDAKIDEFADIILTEWSSEQEKSTWIEGLAAIDAESQREFGKRFVEATPAQRLQLMTRWDAELTTARNARRAWRRDSGAPQPPDHRRLFFHQLRSFTVSGYYSSEVGYTKERKASIIPGIYKPCMPVAEA